MATADMQRPGKHGAAAAGGLAWFARERRQKKAPSQVTRGNLLVTIISLNQ